MPCYYDEKGLAKIRTIVETGVGYLDKGDNLAFMKHCYAVSRSDWRDVGPVVHYLRPSLKTTVIDIVPSDFSKTIYKAPAPSCTNDADVVPYGSYTLVCPVASSK